MTQGNLQPDLKFDHSASERSSRRLMLLPVVGGLMSMFAILLVVWQFDRGALSVYQSQVREDAARELAAVRGAAEIAINRRIHLLRGIKAYVSINPDMTEQEFADLSANIMREANGIRSVTSIKDNVINDVYPRKGNEGAIGIELLKHPTQRAAAELAIETGQPWLAGPIQLVQGGEAFIHRAPVYVTPPGGQPGSGRYWGMVSIVIDKEALVSEILSQVPSDIAIAIRGLSVPGEVREIILGDESIETLDPIATAISLPTGSWQLYGVAKDGWPVSAPNAWLRRAVGLTSALLVGVLVYSVLLANSRYRESANSLEFANRQAQAAREVAEAASLQAAERAEAMERYAVQLEDARVAALNMMEDANHDKARIEAAEKRMRLTIAASPSGMVMVDESGTIVMVNPHMEELFGYGEEEMVGQSIHKLLPVEFREPHVAQLASYVQNPAVRKMGEVRDVEGLHKEGRRILVQVGLNPVRFESGLCVLASVVDMTERVQFERELERANEALQRSNEELEQFAYVASHDLQEPLRKVSSFCELLEHEYGDKLDDDGKQYMGYVVDGAERMRRLIQDLLSFSRIQLQPCETQEFDVSTALEDALYSLQGAIEDSGAVITHDELPTVQADDRQFTQLLQNLVGNGIKYRGEAVPKIHVGVDDDGSRWTFSVSDNGIGIDPQYHERVFGIFKRLHGRSKYSGTGIGLAICKRIVDRLDGDIWIESAEGQGSTFRFTVPKA